MENLMQRFPEKKYDVTNYIESGCLCLWCPCCGWQTKTLHLQGEEVFYKTKNLCSSSTRKRPYAQLGSVELHDSCCGLCVGMSSNLERVNEKGEGGIRPFFGIDRPYTEEICNELRARMEGRGDTAQRKQQTFLMEQITKLTAQVPLILAKRGVAWPPSQMTTGKLFPSNPPKVKTFAELYSPAEEPTFDTQSWNVMCCCEHLNCVSRTVELGPDEVTIRTVRGLDRATITERRPYAQIDDVQKNKGCGCCVNMTAGDLLPEPLSNGTGCDDATITQIVDELKRRIDIRGNIGQMKKLEQIMAKVDDLRVLMTVLQEEMGIDTSYPPSQTVMTSLYGQHHQLPGIRPHAVTSQHFETKEYDVTNLCASACCCFTQKDTIVLEADKQISKSVNCIGDSVNSMPYAQISSVDESRCCFCLRSVNGMMPGCGCSGPLVTEVAQEFQQRKTGRGDIAQLKNQENTMLNALELSVRTGTVLKKAGVPYPPSQATMTEDYGPAFKLPSNNDGYLGEEKHVGPSQQHGEKDYVVTNYCESFCICLCTLGLAGWQSVDLHLGEEEVTMKHWNFCGTNQMRMPYAQLGSVDVETECCGLCFAVETDGGNISPGCGCDKDAVEAISNELQKRKVTRGNIAQVQMQENLMIEVIKMNVQLDQLAKKESVAYPPSQETMEQVFGPGAKVPQKWQAPIMAMGVPGDQTMLQVQLPADAVAGQTLQVQGPGGAIIQLQVPAGALPGQVLQVAAPLGPTVVGAPI